MPVVTSTLENKTNYHKALDIKRLKFIVEQLKDCLQSGAKVLDIGCGNGNISLYLGSLGFHVHGVDISKKAIEKARSLNTYKHVQFDVLSAEEIREDYGKYEAIICSEVLEHLHRPSDLLDVLYDILTPEGTLIVTVPNGKGPREQLVTRPMQKIQQNKGLSYKVITGVKNALGYSGKTVQSDADDLSHIQFFTKSQIQSLAAHNNFTVAVFKNTNFISDVFPYSFFANRVPVLQQIDCKIADQLPYYLTGGFNMVWKKNSSHLLI